MGLESAADEALEEVHRDEVLEFTDYVSRRLARNADIPERESERAVDDIFQMGLTSFSTEAEEALEDQIGRTLQDYRQGELFRIDIPAFSQPFDRRFFRHENAEGGTPGFKEFYRGGEGEWMAFVPKDTHYPTTREKAEQVMTVLHNSEVIEGQGYEMPCVYKPTVAIRDGEKVPAIYGRFNDTMKTKKQMTEEEWSEAQREIAEASQVMAELVVNGHIASSKVNDYYGEDSEMNQAYDFEKGVPVIPDSGELFNPAFEKNVIPFESADEFLEYHNLDERTDNYMEAFGLN
jgi:hypothetical protein